jgi:FkbM family methyltransferase
MSQLSRAIGIARSLVIYHAIPGRQRRMRLLYGQLVRRGDLVFDVGAHVGNRTRAFASLGCRVVALEPQPDFARVLRRLFSVSPLVTVVESAVGREPGDADLAISDRTPTVTTTSAAWREARSGDPDFAGVAWNRALRVPVTTLEALIARFGLPALVKIDVEGAELDVLAGLEQAVPVVSFEYLARALELTEACAARLTALGPYRFNWSAGESFQLASPAWLTPQELITAMRTSFSGVPSSGDVYARLS